jgi:ADP-ribose pyrophosphatase YjhB (NUDIX family)
MEYSEIEIITRPDRYLHHIQVDNVIFGYHDKELKVLLQQTIATSKWTVTGGYVGRDESIEEAAARISLSRTGLKNLFLQQFRCFGNPDRATDAEKNPENLRKLSGIEVPKDLWIFDRFVSVGFYTLTEFSTVEIKKWSLDVACQWWPVSDLPPLMFDHKLVISEALRTLRMHIAFYPIGYELLPEKFTLPEIHALYQTILGRSLDERNFQRKLLASGIVLKLKETRPIGPHRAPYLYKFDQEKYNEGLQSGIVLAF